jgi:hypothetical protein
MKVYVVREDDCYGGGARIVGVGRTLDEARALAEADAKEPIVWHEEAGEDDHAADRLEGRVGGFSLDAFTGFAYAVSEHDLA